MQSIISADSFDALKTLLAVEFSNGKEVVRIESVLTSRMAEPQDIELHVPNIEGMIYEDVFYAVIDDNQDILLLRDLGEEAALVHNLLIDVLDRKIKRSVARDIYTEELCIPIIDTIVAEAEMETSEEDDDVQDISGSTASDY